MIQVDHLTKHYGPVTAIQDVSFGVEKGQIVGFLGPNGAGKSTTMKILSCFMPASGGTARVAGYDVFSQSLEVRKRIGYLPENAPLYADLPVAAYLDFVAEIKGVPRGARRGRVADVMDRCFIADMQHRLIGKLSKGYRQRVGLAQAILHNPDVLILDEPTAGLDPKQIIETRRLIKELAGDHTIILSTHILPEVSQTCQRVVIINKGRVVAVDTPDNLTARLRGSESMYVQIDAGGADAKSALLTIPGVTRVAPADVRNGVVAYEVDSETGRDVRRQLAAAVVTRGWGLLELRPMRMSLEEIFLHLTTEESAAAPAAAGEAADE
jgi:ABC-2 type transport system ATP-binding protein